jgi:phage protein D
MEIPLARRANIELTYKGQDLDLHATSVTYTDNAEGKLDSLDIQLEDRKQQWREAWFPTKKDHISARILCFDWFTPGDKLVLDCGSFEIDAITLEGPPDTVTIKSFSAKVSRNARTERKVHKWEPAPLSKIAEDIAGRAGLKLQWEGNDHRWDRKEQREEGDLNFLNRLCKTTGNYLKVVDDKLFVCSEDNLFHKPIVAELRVGSTWIKNYQFRTQLHDIYQASKVQYRDPWTKEYFEHTHTPGTKPPTSEMLRMRQRVESTADAMNLAKSSLGRKNRMEVEAQFSLVGNPDLHATTRVAVHGFGHFNGEYLIQQAIHVLHSQQGYSTTLHILRSFDN